MKAGKQKKKYEFIFDDGLEALWIFATTCDTNFFDKN